MPIVASRQVGHWTISGCLRDGCRLMHPVRAVHSVYRFNSRCQELTDSFKIRFIIHIQSVFKYHISIPYSLSYYLFKDILNRCTHFIYSFTFSIHILIHVLISYSHSCTHFIYSFMYSFHILIHVLNSYTHSCTHFIYSFMYSIHILIRVLISYTHSWLLGKLPKYLK